MHALRLFSILLFSILFGGPVVPPVSYATHTKMCCTCQNPCLLTCTCRGTNYHCPTCPGGRSPESPDFNNISASTVLVDVRAVRVPDEPGRLTHLMKAGNCARRSFELRILGEAVNSLKLITLDHDDETLHEETVTRQLTADNVERWIH